MTKPYKCRVEYLEGNGNQYIDIGFALKNTHTAELKIKTGATTGASGILGSRSGASSNNFSMQIGNSADLICDFNNSNYSTYRYYETSSANTEYTLFISKNKRIINGTGNTTVCNDSITTPANGYLFGVSGSPLTTNKFVGNIYYCKIYDNDTLARDFIPVLDNSGRPAMYDQVSGQLFYNQGTDEFSYGRQIIPVEYLQADGNQYINTGYKPSNTTGVYAKIQYVNTTKADYVAVGTWLSNNRFVAPFRGSANTGNWYSGWGASEPNAGNAIDTNVHEIYLNYKNDRNISVDTTSITSGLSAISGNWKPLFIFSRNLDGTPSGNMVGKIYGVEITEGTNVVCNYIPAIDENNTPFMFDKVHNTVYLNAGTGQFKVGPNVEKVWGSKRIRKKLALMLANLKKKRPYYCEVEYISNTGSSYIDTGVIPTENTRTVGRFYTESTLNKNWFGGKAVAGPYGCYAFNAFNATSVEYIFGNSGWKTLTASNIVGTPFTVDFSKDGIIINGNSIGTPSYFSFGTGDLTMTLFVRNGGTGYINGRCYYLKIYDNGVLVRDFIPVLDWDYVPCLYDKVSGQLFYNLGSGTFTYGREIHYVDYLESTGTQYIDTEIKPNNNTSVEIDYQLTQATQTRAGLFGALNMSGSNQGRVGSILSPTNSYLEHGYGSGNDYWQQGLPDTNRHLLYQKKNEVYFDGTLIHTFNTATFNLAINAYLGNFLYTNYTPAKAKYYGSRWWNGNDLVRDYKPAIDENGVGFWFDRVSHTIYDNAGTDAFIYPARETEYTGNDGTAAYIDLGTKYKPSMSIEGKYTRDTAGASGSVILVTTTTSAPLIYLPALSGTTTERFVWRRGGYTEQSFFVNSITYPYTMEMVVDAVNDTLTLNGNVVKTGMIAGMNGYNSPYQSDSNMYMFSIIGTYAGDGKVYYLKITDGTTPVFDLVPAYKDGSAGFYNKVDGTFFKNASTNTSTYLVAGKIVESEYE